MLKPTGFWSYTSTDDTASRGRLSQLRRLLADELQAKIGREPKVDIFQDVAAISYGANWEREIAQAIEVSSFLIPIITPAFLHSEWCCREVRQFRARQQSLGRDDLIFPLHYLDVTAFDTVRRSECHDPAVLDYLRTHQWVDFRPLRLLPPDSVEVAQKLDVIADAICASIYRTASGPRHSLGSHLLDTGHVIRDGTDLPEMVLIPPGQFIMGVPPEEEERENIPDDLRGRADPQHEVTLRSGFYLGRYPVTRGEFAAFVATTGHQIPTKAWTYEIEHPNAWSYRERDKRGWWDPGFPQTDRHPAVCITHADAAAYARWLSGLTGKDYRLPSEAEWEYAARAGSNTARFWGDDVSSAGRFANIADEALQRTLGTDFDPKRFVAGSDGFAFTSPVGSFSPNAFGLYDMLGNVWEWTADWWNSNYHGAPSDGSAWTDGAKDFWVVRGGAWGSLPCDVRSGARFRWASTGNRNPDSGFRVARTL